MSEILLEQVKHYQTVARAIEYIRANARRQPGLSEVATAVGLSEFHLQRIFTEWAGLSPKRFLQYLTKEYAKHALLQSQDVLTASLDAGLSGSGRLHDLMVSCEAMSPGEIKTQGKGVTVIYGIAATPFGGALIGWTPRGVCKLAFCDENCDVLLMELQTEWLAAKLRRDDQAAEKMSERIFTDKPGQGKLHLLLRGTNFQIKVWEALLNIGSSKIISYSALARLAGAPKAQRAVGSALAANKIGFLIPCHRVIRESGDVGVYHWGADRKAAMLVWESGQSII